MHVIIIFSASVVLLLASLALSISFTTKKHRSAYQQGKVSRNTYLKNVGIEILGILLTLLIVIWVGSAAGKAAATAVQQAGGGSGLVILAAIIVALAVGFVVGSVVKWVWGKLTTTQQPKIGGQLAPSN